MKFDKYGLVVQTNGDGGDSPARTGLFYFLQWAILHFKQDLKYHSFQLDYALRNISLENPLRFFRNPVSYVDSSDMSRDQTNPLLVAMGAYRFYDLLGKYLLTRIKNFMFYQNGDLTGPADLGVWIRAFRFWPFYPLLFICDWFLFFNSVIRIIRGRNYDDVGDDINHTLLLLQAAYFLPTPVSLLSRKVYAKYRPAFSRPLGAPESSMQIVSGYSGVQYAWDWYFRVSTGANEFNEIARPLIKEWFS